MKAIIFILLIVWRKSIGAPEADSDVIPDVFCDIPIVDNAQILPEKPNHETYHPGTTITVKCLLGYHTNSVSEFYVTCKNDGKWNRSLSLCEEQQLFCKAPDVKNARIEPELIEVETYEIGMGIDIVCLPGFHNNRMRHFHFICMDDGNWDSEFPVCEDVTCGFPNKPENGQVFLTNKSLTEPYPFGSEVIYQCNLYYVLEGPKYRWCEASGWSNKDPYCKAIECEGFPAIENGRVSATKNNIFPEEEVPIQCNLGYKPTKGIKAFLTCTTAGQWDMSNSYCSAILCDPPLEPEHGSFKLDESGTEKKPMYEFADRISYFCDHGYSLDGKKVHTCRENGWTDLPPKCAAVRCSVPPVPSNGWIIPNTLKEGNYEVGNLVAYQCREGYKLFGNAERMCTERGWDGVPAHCKKNSCAKPKPSKGFKQFVLSNARKFGQYLSSTSVVKYFDFGDRLTLQCEKGYKKNTHTEAVCLENGEWSIDIDCVEVTCGIPTPLENGWIRELYNQSGTIFPAQFEISYECNTGYSIQGPPKRRCTVNGWTILNGSTTANTACRSHQKWKSQTPPPQSIIQKQSNNGQQAGNFCNTPQQIANGWINGVPPGSLVKYRLATRISYGCYQGYTFIGEKIRTCTKNGWSGTNPICQANFCHMPEQVTNGWVSGVPTASPSLYHLGTTISYNCKQGYTLIGEQIRTCTKTGWSGTKPICQEQLCPYPEVENGGVQLQKGNLSLQTFGFATVTCNVGFKLKDTNSIIQCSEDGHWKHIQNICEKILCDAPRNLKNGFVENKNESYPFGSKAVYRCSDGYQLYPPSGYLECSSNGWHGPELQCIETRCQLPESIDNGRYKMTSPPDSSVSDSHVPVKTILTYTCIAPYKINGETEIRCLANSLWSADPPTCESNYCTKPQINNTEPISGHFRYHPANKVTMQCIAGYKLVSGSELECQENGSWKPSSVICEEILCTPPSPILFGKIVPVKKYYKYGDIIQYRCNNSVLVVNGTREHKCTENGWDGDTPSCVVKKKHNITCSCPNDLSVKLKKTCGLQSMFQVGDSISLDYDSSNESSEVSEKGIIICSPNGTWFAQTVDHTYTKAGNCPEPPPIPNARLFEMETSYHIGATVYIICDNGFRLFSGPDYLVCQPDRTWNNSLAQCKPALCGSPSSPANGSIENLKYGSNYSWPFHSEVHFLCNLGFQLHGHHWLKCTENGWSGCFPTCKKISCIDPDMPEEGRKLVQSLSIGSKSQFGCFSGYRLIGPKERICLKNGQWSGMQPRCETGRTDCPVLSTPENGVKTGSQYNEYDVVSFTCNSGFVLVGSKMRLCRNGSWTGSDSYCIGKDQFNVQEEISRDLQQFLTELSSKQRRLMNQDIQEDLGLQKMAVQAPKHIVLYMILDASSSVGHINFQRQKNFSRALIEKLDISQSGTRVGVITFSSRATAEFYPDDFHSKHNILDALNKTTCKTNGASLHSALEILEDMIKETKDALTEGVAENHVFILTNGKAKGGLNPLGITDRLKEKHAIHFTCISLTGQTHKDILYGIASDYNHAYFLDSYSTMDWLTDQINQGTLDYSKCGHLPLSNDLRPLKQDVFYSWPWTVLISYEGKQKCKGSLISHKWVLTSASCVTTKTEYIMPENLSLNLDLSKMKLEVQTIHIHPECSFNISSMSNNAALILLKDGVRFTNEIRPICLPSSVDGDTLYRPGEYGYERVQNGKQSSLIVKDKNTCKAALPKAELSDNTFCAQHTEDHDASDYNQGSSFSKFHPANDGEPVWTQIGITSFCQGNLYCYFTNVLTIKNWITAFVKN